MADINVRVLGEEDWQIYRDLRLEALRESPDAFVAGNEGESSSDAEQLWRAKVREGRRLVSDNGPAVAFASTIGFLPTSERRPTTDPDDAEDVAEVAMVLALAADPRSVKNPQLP